MPQLNKIDITLPTGSKKLSFNPKGISPSTGVASLAAAGASGSMLGEDILTLSLNPSTRSRRSTKPRVKLAFPTTVTTTGAQSNTSEVLSRTAIVDCQFTFADTSTTAERVEAMEAMVQVLQNAIVVDMVSNVNGIY